MNRLPALVLNTILPGTGLLLRRSGWLPAIPACIGIAGLTLLIIAYVTTGTESTISLGWIGLGAYLTAALFAGTIWLREEQSSSRDLTAIQPIFQTVARHYLTNDLPAAEQAARKLVRLAASDPGTWR